MTFLAAFAGIVWGTVQASFYEWAFHRYWLHRPWLPKGCFTGHTLIHHQLCKFDDTFHVVEGDEEQHEALTFQWWAGAVLIAIIMAPWALIAWGLSAAGIGVPYVPFVLGVGAASVLYYLGYEGTHYLMHKPTIGWFERSRFFRFIKRHHQIHHVQMDRNLNVFLPIGDYFLRTLVLEGTTAGTTPANARRLARRHSQYAKRHGLAEASRPQRAGEEPEAAPEDARAELG